MLSVKLLGIEDNVYDLSYLNNLEKSTIVVCPGPVVADNFRSMLDSEQLKKTSVITISKFVQDEFLKLGLEKSILRKADILFQLSLVWPKFFKNSSDQIFFNTYNLLSELRSFSLDFELFNEALIDLDEESRKALSIMWMYINQVELIDEHKAYDLLSQNYKDAQSDFNEFTMLYGEGNNIVFYGFSHLSGVQLDLLNSLGIYHDVFVPFSKEVYLKSKPSDYIKWLLPEQKDLANDERQLFDLNVIEYNKSRLAETFKGLNISKEANIVLAQKNPSLLQIGELGILNPHFKTNVTGHESLVSKVFLEFEDSIPLALSSFIELIGKVGETYLKNQNFFELKICELVNDLSVQILELTDSEVEFDSFYLRVFKEITLLAMPRMSMIPLNRSIDARVKIMGIESIEAIDTNNPNYFVFSSTYNPLLSFKEKFSQKMMSFLSNIGPLRRSEFEFLSIKERVLNIALKKESYFLIEKGMEENDAVIASLLTGILKENIKKLDVSPYKNENILINEDIFSVTRDSDFKPNLSSTKLQLYLDCPRKYFYKYELKHRSNLNLKKSINPLEIGRLEHLVVEKYFEDLSDFNEVDELRLKNIIDKEFGVIISDKDILYQADNKSSYIEVTNYTFSTINFLLKLASNLTNVSMQFEKNIGIESDGVAFSGSIDCMIESEQGLLILDFKRTSFSIPSQKEIINFEKIQLPFYLNKISKFGTTKFLGLGYISMGDLDSSLVLADGNSNKDFLADAIGDIVKVRKIDDFEPYNLEYEAFETEKIGEIKSASSFPCNPRKLEVCEFCEYEIVCTKGIDFGK